VVRRRIAFEADPQAFTARWQAQQDALRAQVAQAQRLLPGVALDDAMLELISHLCCEFEVASLRADIVMHKTARAIAALQARARSRRRRARRRLLVLPHRRRRKPFEQAAWTRTSWTTWSTRRARRRAASSAGAPRCRPG
jgi:magnesium chelatase subunit D